ncbi:hypothetical protein QQ008_13555 [Fulvivirgaceae bacterium BMA10]|uniref:Uncharacterized protein n=1 Tax=Splendidivirga corallicola TaxID=3051826 RepID=A0ABT8KNS5_9BACT|nr:hypothetical protein [Fulvivirgaceae bacterium BMA10]
MKEYGFNSPIKKYHCFAILTILFSIYFTGTGWAQQHQVNSLVSLAEKIYIQLDGKVYTNDQTIWFKAIVTKTIDHSPTTLSGVLYVELINPNEEIVRKKLIKIQDGTGDGFFQLHEDDITGRYLVRAYTQWNQNFGGDFMFEEYIDIFPSSTGPQIDPISNITLVEKSAGEFWLNATLDPLKVDSLHQKKLKVFLNLDGKRDSVLLKKDKNEKYSLDYQLKNEVQFATLHMQTENLADFTKTISLDKSYLDLQFFPESGEMVHGLNTRVAFKALDYQGKGKTIQGDIMDQDGNLVTAFKSNTLGMGTFRIKPDSGTIYYARLSSAYEEGLSLKYPLPEVETLGNILSVTKNGKMLRVQAVSNYMQKDSIYVLVSSRGIAYYEIKGELKDGRLLFPIPSEKLPEGVIAFTLMDNNKQVIAERLHFNERQDARLDIKLSTNKDSFTQREKTSLNIKATDSNNSVAKASMSVLVINKEQMGKVQDTRQNILSYFLLNSELKGEIENPGHYFQNENQHRQADLDALLLTHGWRRYLYAKPIDTLVAPPERVLNVSGSVGAIFSEKKKKKGIELTMMVFEQPAAIQTQKTDSLGRFHFNLNDQYGQHLNILIQSNDKSGKKKPYSIELDEKLTPEISFDQSSAIASVDSVVHSLVEKHQERKQVEDAFRLTSGVLILDEVVIEDYQMTPDREKVMKAYGKPDVVIDGKEIQAKEEPWSYGLYSILLFHYSDIIRIRQVGGQNFLYASVLGDNRNPTLVVVDGEAVPYDSYALIPNIPAKEIKSVEVIKFAKNFLNLYMEFAPGADPYEVPKLGHLIAVYTHKGKGIFGIEKSGNLFRTSVPVFSPPREFYAPKYEKLSPKDWVKPDFRALVHWEPNLKTDSTGSASIDFYNADVTGEMQVIVEAISDDGKIGYQELIYDVKKRKR